MTRSRTALLLGLLVLTAAHAAAAQTPASAPASAPTRYDVIIRGGRLLDGAGNPWRRADVGVRGDRIVAVGDLREATAVTVVDATGLYVAPGFIDTHSHAGGALADATLGAALPLLAQGVTTVLVNPDGGGPTDLAAQRRALEVRGVGVNVGLMVPHGSVRGAVIGSLDRAPSPDEMRRMEDLVRRGMEEGAFALSSGPFYAPGSFATTDELVALARVAARWNAPYQSHIRDESDYTIGLLAAVEEVITVAREAGTRGVVTHVKALGPNVWGMGAAVAARIERARAAGVEVFADQYPYDASSTSLGAALLPRWAQAGGTDSLRRRLADPATRARIATEARANLARRGGADRIRIASYGPDSQAAGRSLADLARAGATDPVPTALAMLERADASVVSFNMHDDDIAVLMRRPWTMTASDGGLQTPGRGVPHPRNNGAFARKLRKYVVEERVVGLEDAVRSMTSLPAAVYNIPDRGALRPGAFADIAVFDLARVRDVATYDAPHGIAEGMTLVLVNGTIAWRDGRATGQRGGRVLRRP